MFVRSYREECTMTDVDGVLDQLDEDAEDESLTSSESDGEPDGQRLNESLPPRTPDLRRGARAKGVRKASTDPARVGSRRNAKYLSDSSDDEDSAYTVQRLKKAPGPGSHNKAKRQKANEGGCRSSVLVGGTPSTSAHVRKVKSVPRKITDKETPEVVSKSRSGADLISAQLGEITNILHTLDKRVANTEKELKNIKAKLQSASSTESSTKEMIPLVARVRILS